MSSQAADHETCRANHHIKKEIPSRAVNFFHNGTNVHEHHHVEPDVNQTAVQEHCGNQPVPLMSLISARTKARQEPIQSLSVHAPQDAESAELSRLNRAHQLGGKKHDIQDQNRYRHRRVSAEKFGKPFAPSSEPKPQVRSAFVASRCINSNQRAARGTQLRPLLAASKHPAEDLLPAVHPVLPLIRKGQHSSLHALLRVPIIPESHSTFRSAEKKGLPWTNLKRSASGWRKSWLVSASLLTKKWPQPPNDAPPRFFAKLPKNFPKPPENWKRRLRPGAPKPRPPPNPASAPPPLLTPALYFDPVAAALPRKAPPCL